MQNTPPTPVEAICLENLCKSFGSVQANHNVCLTVYRGEILALLGENGSGKTTLVNMLSGIYRPDSGRISVNGRPVSIRSPKEAIGMGIGMIHQHFKLVDVLTARENIMLGMKGRLSEDLQALCARFGLDVDLDKKIYNMSVGEKQTVEIVKVLARGADILILDEPTAVLTPQETEKLFAILRKMRAEGHAVVIITHKLAEVLDVSDRVTILRKGESVGTVITAQTNVQQLTELMVGRPVSLRIDREELEPGETLLDVHDLCVTGEDGVRRLDHISFQLHEREILGVCGVAGSGQKELCEAIAGLQQVDAGSILMEGKRVDGLTPREIIRKGIALTVDWATLDCVVVGEAANGAEGLEKAEKCDPDLIITDLKMPQMDGIEMLERLRQAGKTTHVIILTAYDSFSYVQTALRLEAVDYLLKPFHDGDLEKAVQRVQAKLAPKQTVLPEPKTGSGNRYVSEAIQYIKNHYQEPDISVSSVAQSLNISEGHLSHTFRKETGSTLLGYLTRYRIHKAAELLKDCRVKVYEVAEQVGYRDIGYFSNTFKKITGKTPSEYQDSLSFRF